MSRRRVDPSGELLLMTGVRLTNAQRIELRRRGGSAWLRAMLNTNQKERHEPNAHRAQRSQ